MKFIYPNECVLVEFKKVEREGKAPLHFVKVADKTTYENVEGFASQELVDRITQFREGETVQLSVNIQGKFANYDLEKIKAS